MISTPQIVFPFYPSPSFSRRTFLASLLMFLSSSREKIRQGLFPGHHEDQTHVETETQFVSSFGLRGRLCSQCVEPGVLWILGWHTLGLSFSGKTVELYNQWKYLEFCSWDKSITSHAGGQKPIPSSGEEGILSGSHVITWLTSRFLKFTFNRKVIAGRITHRRHAVILNGNCVLLL